MIKYPKKQPRAWLQILSLAITMAYGYSSSANAACRGSTQDITFAKNLPAGLTVPLDAPMGTVIYSESIPATLQRISCDWASSVGHVANPELGFGRFDTFPLGRTGLSFKIMSTDNSYLRVPTQRPYASFEVLRGYYRLEIIKTGPLTSESKLVAGPLAEYRAADHPIAKFDLANPLVLTTASCQTPSVSVQMGDDYQLQAFEKIGATSEAVKFNIGLKNCQSGINKVRYSISANTQVINERGGSSRWTPAQRPKVSA